MIRMGKILKKMQQLQADMALRQKELASLTVQGESGGGMVKVEIDGEGQVLSVRIDPELVKKGDVEMLEELVAAAFNNAAEKLEPEIYERFGDLAEILQVLGML